MARPTNEQLFEWANDPPAWHIDAFAGSVEEAAILREYVVSERRSYMLGLCADEFARRGVDVAPGLVEQQDTDQPDIDFSKLPLRPTLNRMECYYLSGQLWSGFASDWHWSQARAHEHWNRAAEIGAYLGGFSLQASKYAEVLYPDPKIHNSDEMAAAEAAFLQAYERSNEISRRGYRSPVLMDGIDKIGNASLDLELIERDLDTGPSHFRPSQFWEQMIEIKWRYDNNRGRSTYADVTKELVDGVYHAPYLDATVRDSGQYLSKDTVVATSVREGRGVRFGSTLYAKLLSIVDEDDAVYRVQHDTRWRESGPPGLIFMHARLLPFIKEYYTQTNAPLQSGIVDKLIDQFGESTLPLDEAEYRYLVFGE